MFHYISTKEKDRNYNGQRHVSDQIRHSVFIALSKTFIPVCSYIAFNVSYVFTIETESRTKKIARLKGKTTANVEIFFSVIKLCVHRKTFYFEVKKPDINHF